MEQPLSRQDSLDRLREEEEERWRASHDVARYLLGEISFIKLVLIALLIIRSLACVRPRCLRHSRMKVR